MRTPAHSHWPAIAALVLGVLSAGALPAGPNPGTSPAPVRFSRDILPVLSDNCFSCHGPDEKARKARLRLDLQEEAFKPAKSGARALVPRKPGESELLKRIFTTDSEEVMPPPKSQKKLSPAQKDLLKRWIVEGAPWQGHWAYEPLLRPALPPVKKASWVRNEIDRFVLARLEQEGIPPSPEADKTTLLRRLTLDLTGLPPTPAEVDAFLADTDRNAYGKVVKRLFASPHYGERMALPWLDAARYADSNGFQQDGDTHQYVWRDWVVNAFNTNLPFDQFTVLQLAGDLLPDPTLDQKVATGFNRCHLLNGEGGAIAEEQRNIIVFDRVDVTATTWLGVTLACCQCHDHKYDPFTQREYYQFFAYFNNVPESGTPSGGGQYRIADPALVVGNESEMAKLKELDAAVAAASAEAETIARSPDTEAAQAAWEKTALTAPSWQTLQFPQPQTKSGASITSLDDQSLYVSGTRPDNDTYTLVVTNELHGITGLRLETVPDDRLPSKGAGRSDSGNAVLTDFRVTLGGKKISFRKATADYSQQGFTPGATIDEDAASGWAFYPDTAKPHALILEAARPIDSGTNALTVTLDFQFKMPQHVLGRFRLAATTHGNPAAAMGVKSNILSLLQTNAATRSAEAAKQIREYFLTNQPPEPLKTARETVNSRKKAANELRDKLPRVMVMSDAKPRQTHLLERGNYEMPRDVVAPGTPASLPPMPAEAPRNRLGLARWLVSPENPLTARVQVNRQWQLFFARGIVKTTENLGTQSEAPVHRELLDWLAAEFRETGWNVKGLQERIVTSATYRQSSKVSPHLRERDPENQFLARSARFRLPSLLLRDVALAASGLLDRRFGGKPVYPYQPKGIWDGLAITNERDFTYPQSKGQDLYRRSLYTFWRRTVAPGNMFDASTRQTCKVRTSITSTPLHALTMLNDVTWVEAGRALAEHIMKEGGPDPSARLAEAYRRVCARRPTPADARVLRRTWERSLASFRADPKAAMEFLQVGERPRDTTLDPAEYAAYANTCLAVFNLDEALTRE